MKTRTPALLILIVAIAFASLGSMANAQIAIGKRSDEVKAIQEILKTDPEIYPEGYVTGYYGNLTEKAIKKLQARCGIPQTGVVDAETEKCIYPIGYSIKVVSPNGGESWSRNEIQTIKWKVEIPETIAKEKKPYPFWFKGTIDLFRRISTPCTTTPGAIAPECPTTTSSAFVKHIATVNLLDGSYSWRIASDIPNAKDYVIRISSGPGAGSIWYREKAGQTFSAEEIWPVPPRPTHIYWDESDGTFEITGEPNICPPCSCQDQSKVIAMLEKIIEELQKAIAALK